MPLAFAFAFAAGAVGAVPQTPAQAPFNASLLRPQAMVRAHGPLDHAFTRAQAATAHVVIEVRAATPFEIHRPGTGVILATGAAGGEARDHLLLVTPYDVVAEADGAADKRLYVRVDRRQLGDPAAADAADAAETPPTPSPTTPSTKPAPSTTPDAPARAPAPATTPATAGKDQERDPADEGKGQEKHSVTTLPGVKLPAEIVARDKATGLCLLRAKLAPGARAPEGLVLAADPAPGDPAALVAFTPEDDRIAFAGVVAESSGGVMLRAGGEPRQLSREEILLTDAAIQRRCHGAALVGVHGQLIGVCNAEHVPFEKGEPTLEELKAPSYGFVIPARSIRKAFGEHLGPPPPPAPRAPSPRGEAVAKAAPAVVAVYGGISARPELGLEDPYAKRRRAGVGSGVIVDGRGLVLTNRHLVRGKERIRVTLADGRTFGARIVQDDHASNTALLQLEPSAGEELPQLPALPLEPRFAVAVGDPILTLGRPEPQALTVGSGVLSASRRGTLQTDAPIGNQNGGGAVLDAEGRLVGLADAGLRDAVDVAFAQRGDRAKVETSLNFAPSCERLYRTYQKHLQSASVPGTENGAAAAAGQTQAPSPPEAAPDTETPKEQQQQQRQPAAQDPREGADEPPPAHAPGSPIGRTVARTVGSMLNIYVVFDTAPAELEDNPFATPKPPTQPESLGSGVIIDPTGLALTNWHVVDSATEPSGAKVRDRAVMATLHDGQKFEVDVLSISREEDLALIRLRLQPGQEVAAVELGSSAALRIGDPTIAIGNPHGRASTITAGVLTAKNQTIRIRDRWAPMPNLLETDAAINAGNSGGALIDYEGRLIGINSAGGSLHSTTGFAIAVDRVREALHTILLTPEKLRSPWIGVQVRDEDGHVVVAEVDPFGPAARAGIAAGDVLASIDGAPVQWSVGYAMQLLRLAPDRPVPFELRRGGKTTTVDVAPLSAAAWAALRQTRLDLAPLTVQDDAESVRQAAIAAYRRFSGDPTAAPSMLPASLVRVLRRHPELPADVDVQPGDLLLGVELTEAGRAGDMARFVRFESVRDVQDCINEHSTYEGTKLTAWIYRAGKVQLVELPVKRLML